MTQRDVLTIGALHELADKAKAKKLVEDLKAVPGVVWLSDEAEVIALHLIKAGWRK